MRQRNPTPDPLKQLAARAASTGDIDRAVSRWLSIVVGTLLVLTGSLAEKIGWGIRPGIGALQIGAIMIGGCLIGSPLLAGGRRRIPRIATAARLRDLRFALVAVGLIFIVGVYPLTQLWPSGWRWQPEQPEYLQMILALYATLGVFLLLAAWDPLRHLSVIWFTVWSSMAHGAIMAWHALQDPAERGHLPGDVLGLALVAVVLAVLTQRAGTPA